MTKYNDSPRPNADDATRDAAKELENRLGKLLSEHSQISRMVAVRSVIDMMRRIVRGHLQEQLSKAGEGRTNERAFENASATTLSILDQFGHDIYGLARRVSTITKSPVQVSDLLGAYREMRSEIEADLILSKQEFLDGGGADKPKQAGAPINRGGKPLARHWDAVWAEIAFQLWNGELQPKTQADIKRAMFTWFSAQGIDVGDTAVTQRARQLWQLLDQSD